MISTFLDLDIPFSMCGGLPGNIQNAPRGELYAIFMVAMAMAMHATVTVVVDSAFVHDHLHLPIDQLRNLAESDLWNHHSHGRLGVTLSPLGQNIVYGSMRVCKTHGNHSILHNLDEKQIVLVAPRHKT